MAKGTTSYVQSGSKDFFKLRGTQYGCLPLQSPNQNPPVFLPRMAIPAKFKSTNSIIFAASGTFGSNC